MVNAKNLVTNSWLQLGIAAALIAVPAIAQVVRVPIFQHEILPVLQKNCIKCHGETEKMAGLDLTSVATIMKGGASGPAITPGKPDRSLLWKMIETGKMPVSGVLSEADKKALFAWIEQGRFPSADAAQQERRAAKITPEARQFWSFKKPVKYPVPAVKNAVQVKTPIDAFVLQKLEQKGWKMQPEADRVTLMRRAYFDLIGLPPTPAEVKSFAGDKSPNAYEKVIDRLLASPRYGERWGRHWLDIAGYSDSVGDAYDRDRPVSYRYRDYVIKAFNSNKPYNQFLMEQLAGDQMVNYKPLSKPAPEQIEPLTATGFLRVTADITDNQTIYQVDKYFDALQNSTETSLKALMGVTINCARCHDHKFDPILQEDYFKLSAAFQAAFDPENWLAGNIGFGEWPSRYVLNMEPEDRDAWIQQVTGNGSRDLRRQQTLLQAEYDRYRQALAGGTKMTQAERAGLARDVANDPDADAPDPTAKKSGPSDAELERMYPDLAKKADEVRALVKASEKIKPNYIWALWDVSKTPSPTYVLMRGNYLAPGNPVQPGILSVLDDPQKPFQFPDPQNHPEWNHTGRRLTLAKWLTHPDHPLTARVFVNRVWQFHLGEGIVRTPDDFGSQGARPTHAELLDYLATSFVEHGWDIKWLTKQIMMSQVYRQASTEVAEQFSEDPSNKLLWRKAPLRLEAEVIRDSMLKISGMLNEEMFGPPEPIRRAEDGQWVEDEKQGNPNRRSIYLVNARTRPEGFLHAFDAPEMAAEAVSQRFRSALPTQALALLNNPLVMRTSRAFASRVIEECNRDLDSALDRAFELAYSRKARPEELEVARKLMASSADPKDGLRLFLQALMGANDFLYSY